MKTIIKIIYIAFSLILAVIIALGMYTSFASDNYSALLTNAVTKAEAVENYQDADYNDIVRSFSIFATPLEDAPDVLYAEENGKNITFIYESVNQHNASYTQDGKTVDVNHIENVYLVVILSPNFYYKTNSDKTNPSAFRFYNGTQTFDYYFNLNADCNSAIFKEKPTTEKDAVLYGSRTLLDTYRENYDLIFFPMTETTIGYIKEELGGVITGFNIADNEGNNVYKNSTEVPFAFDYPKTAGTFYYDMADFVRYYNIYADNKNGVGNYDEETVTAASVYVEAFMQDPSSKVADFNSKYIQGYPHEAVYTGTPMVMKCIGITALFIVAVGLLYILLFHFKSIKKFVRRFSKKAEPERVVPNRPQTNVVISKSKVKREPSPDQVKREVTQTPAVVETKAEEVEDAQVVEEAKVAEEAKVEETVEAEEVKTEETVEAEEVKKEETVEAIEATEEATE